MSKIQLNRIVKPVTVVSNDGARIEQRTESVGVSFAGPDGRTVSLAFDGRCDCKADAPGMIRETYAPYADCAVIDGEYRQSGPMPDIQVMRFLRDALIDLDLGDYDPRRVCIVCGGEFEPASPGCCNVCADCEDSD